MIRHYTPAVSRMAYRRWFAMFLLIFCITAAQASSRVDRDETCVACSDPGWTATGTYTGGTRVSMNNKIYEARWWTQGENPETRSGEWDVWRYIGPCDGGNTNVNPTVSLTAPANGASFTAPASITLTATASDADGSVVKVGFYNGATLLGEDTTDPYSYTWASVPAGTYSVRAIATDNAGATGTSTTASVTVNGNTGGGCNVPSYVNGSAYSTGDEVQYNNKKYKCEVGGWCSLGGAYEPGIGWAWDNAWELLGDCTGGNNGPSVTITAPTAGTNFPVGQSISIAATASDADGSVTKVEFLVDGAEIGEDASAPYSISWTTTQGFHTLVARATDNNGFTKESAAVSVAAGEVNTGGLPARVMSGYWHTWGGGVPFVKLRDVSPKWDVINISFVEPVTVGSTNGQVKFVLSGATADYTVANFKSDIKLLQSQGKKIVISIGGYEGYFSLTTPAARNTFVSNMKSIIDEYGFDGIDIDLEQSSLELETGDADFRNPTSPKVVQMIGAIRDLCNHYGNNFILTFAPEAFYLQLGYQWYAGLHSSVDRRAGVYIPVIHALRDKITYVQSQLYNQPAIMALNGTLYSSGTPDYLVSMTDMLLKGFNVGGNPSYFFPPLRPDQVVIAVPSSAGAAGSGQVTNQQLQQAFTYIVKGQSYGGQYTMTSTYPALRGIMAWSINWDVLQNNNSFVNANRTYLDGLGAPAAAARAAAPVASVQAVAAVPAGWGDFQVGLVSDNTNIINARMKKALQENVKLNYRYAYVNNGVDPSSNALSWLFNQWGTDYSRNSQEMGLRPAYVIYMLQEEGGAAALKNNIRNADFMRKYFSSIRTVAEKSNGYKAIFVIEPDTWGYFLQNALEQGTVSDPRQVPATVSNLGAGYEHLAGLPNTLSGVAQGIIRTLRLYAPDSYNGLLMSFWSVNGNGVTGPPVADGAKGMVYWNQGDVTYSAQRNAEFANQLLPATGDRGDFIGVEKNGWSAGNWFVKQNRRDYYWNDTQNAKWVSWSKTLSQGVSLPLLGWQISIGHMGLPNTVNRYEDTFMPYFFTHKQEFFDAGFIGFLAGKGLADCTDFTNLNGNAQEANGNAGDNGWFFEQLKAFDAGRPYLTGVTPTSVSITSPAAQSSFVAPASIQIAATAGAGPGGTVTKVEFFQGAVKLGEDTSAPYTVSWTNVAAGSYSLTAKVTTSSGTTATSSTVAITVTVPNTNTPPVVSVTAPAGGATYVAPATVVLQASASDNVSVAKVEFFQGAVKLAEVTAAPYTYTWNGVAAGGYTLTARATDNEGVSTTSAAVTITVANPTGGCTGVPQYVENSGYVAGSQVQQGGAVYQCREWPYSGWCNGAAWAYGPGTGMYWQDAWVLKGACGAQQRVAAADAFAAEGATITLYPNPGESNRVNVVTIDFTHDAGDVALQVMKADGAQLVDRKYQGVQRSLQVEVPSLPSGLYLIRIGAGTQSGLVRYLVR